MTDVATNAEAGKANFKNLVIWAHPVPDSYSAALCDEVRKALQQSCEVINLYESGFKASYMTDSTTEPSANADTETTPDTNSDPNAKILNQHRSQIASAEALLFVYPTWWDGLPAILKSWLEQMFPEALDTNRGHQAAQKTLQHIKSVMAVTTHGSSKWVNIVQGQAGRKTLRKSLAGLCHSKCKFTWVPLYRIDVSTNQQRKEFLSKANNEALKATS